MGGAFFMVARPDAKRGATLSPAAAFLPVVAPVQPE